MFKTYGYARVSTKEQNLDLQLSALKEFGVDEIFTDDGLSGANRERPGLLELLSLVEENDKIVFWDWDRLSRDSDYSGWLRVEMDFRGVQLIDLHQEHYDDNDPESILMAGMKQVLADYERANIRRRSMKGVKEAKTRGVHVGRRYCLNKAQMKRFLELNTQKEQGTVRVKDIIEELDISRTSYYNLIKAHKAGLLTTEKLTQ